MKAVRSCELLPQNFWMFLFLLKVIGALLLQMFLKIHEIQFYDYYTWLSENVMLLAFLKWAEDKRERLPVAELVPYFIYGWSGRIWMGKGETVLLVETVDFFSNTVVLEQIRICVRAEFWKIMLKRKKMWYSAPAKPELWLVLQSVGTISSRKQWSGISMVVVDHYPWTCSRNK